MGGGVYDIGAVTMSGCLLGVLIRRESYQLFGGCILGVPLS